ncbi:MAG: type II toxin-antitoxin system VapC family toxin [Chloroflexota bacterium]
MTVCVDASLVVKFLTLEDNTDKALTWLDIHGADRMVAPTFLAGEVAAAIRQKERRGVFSVEKGNDVLSAFMALNVELVWDYDLLKRALEMAVELNEPTVYDTLYLAVAERHHCDYWTADARFARAAASPYPFVRLL